MNTSALIFQIQSTLIVALLTYGIIIKKNRSKHVRTMLTAIIWDILLVLQIELTRSAILKASKVVSNPMILTIHVALALTTVILYGFMFWSGRKILKGENEMRGKHKILGITTYLMRIATYVTSYFAVMANQS